MIQIRTYKSTLNGDNHTGDADNLIEFSLV